MTSSRPSSPYQPHFHQQAQLQQRLEQPSLSSVGSDPSMFAVSALSASPLVPAASTPLSDAAPTPLPSCSFSPQLSHWTILPPSSTSDSSTEHSPQSLSSHFSSSSPTSFHNNLYLSPSSRRPALRYSSRHTSRLGVSTRLARTNQISVARPLRRNRPFRSQCSSELYGAWDMAIKCDRWPPTPTTPERGGPCTKGRIGGGSAGGSKRGGGVTNVVLPGPGVGTGASGHVPGTHLGQEGNHSSDGSSTNDGSSRPASGATLAPMETSNSTTSWTVGVQPRHGKSTFPPTSDTSSSSYTHNKPHAQDLTAAPAFSSRSSFLRALGKFKSKHLHQRRPSTSRPQMNIASAQSSESGPTSFVLPTIHLDSTNIDSHPSQHPATADFEQDENATRSNPSSSRVSGLTFIPARPEAERMPSHNSPATIDRDTVASILDGKAPKSSLRVKLKNRMSHTLASIKSSSNLKEKARQQQQQQEQHQQPVSQSTSMASADQAVMGGKSSTVSDDATTASGSGSINKDKSLRHSRSFWSFPRVRLGDGDGPQIGSSKAIQDRPQSMNQPVSTTVASTLANLPNSAPTTNSPPPTAAADEDVLMLSPEQGPTADQHLHDDDFDSDDSIDIITPLDYSDYTLHAELPLKKRKKLEAAAKRSSLAALAASSSTASSHRPHSVRTSADAMKRFLQLQRQTGARGRAGLSGTKTRISIPGADAYEPVGATISQDSTSSLVNENKKRGKRPSASAGDVLMDTQDDVDEDEDIDEQPIQAINAPTMVATKRQDGEPTEWKRSLLRSLPFGRNMKKDQVIKIKPRAVGLFTHAASTANTTEAGTSVSAPLSSEQETMIVMSSREMKPAAGSPMGPPPAGRVARTGSVHSRSHSFASSTHPGLMATTGMVMPRNRMPGQRRETLEMAMRRRRLSSAARSRYSDAGLPSPIPGGANSTDLFNVDNSSNANVTHTFTSFTLEFVDMHHAHDVMNKSVVPGLFNFKQRQHRLTISSVNGMAPQPPSQPMEMDQEFKGFDSDAVSGYTGDADVSMESITVEARASAPPAIGSSALSSAGAPSSQEAGSTSPLSKLDREKEKAARQFGFGGVMARRKISSVDGESDTISELPVLSIRTRDLGTGSSKHAGRVSRPPLGTHTIPEDDNNNNSRPRSPTKKRVGAGSPTLSRKTSRGMLAVASAAMATSPDGRKDNSKHLTMDDVLKWEPQEFGQSSSGTPSSSAVAGKVRPESNLKPLVIPKGSGDSNATTLVPSSGKTPHSSGSTLSSMALSVSPSNLTPHTTTRVVGRGIPSPLDAHHPSQHMRQQSSLHDRQASSSYDGPHSAILPQHLKNFSTASTLSASSGYSAQTLTPGLHHYPSLSLAHSFIPDRSTGVAGSPATDSSTAAVTTSGSGVVEFDPSAEFPPTTPSDLKAMDFETLLQAAEREQQKGWEELKVSKKLLQSMQEHQQHSRGTGMAASQGLKHARTSKSSNRNNDDEDDDDDDDEENRYRAPYHPKSALTAAMAANNSSTQSSAPRVTTSTSAPSVTSTTTTTRPSSTQPLRPAHPQRQGSGQASSVVFDLGDSSGLSDSAGGRGGGYGTAGTTGSGSGSAGGPNRTKRIMKQKKSVIRLTGQGSVQGRREDDGVIRVSKSMVTNSPLAAPTTTGRS